MGLGYITGLCEPPSKGDGTGPWNQCGASAEVEAGGRGRRSAAGHVTRRPLCRAGPGRVQLSPRGGSTESRSESSGVGRAGPSALALQGLLQTPGPGLPVGPSLWSAASEQTFEARTGDTASGSTQFRAPSSPLMRPGKVDMEGRGGCQPHVSPAPAWEARGAWVEHRARSRGSGLCHQPVRPRLGPA